MITLLVLALAVVNVFALSGVAFAANPSANLDQCANDPAPSPNTDGCDSNANQWVNGNLGSSKSFYKEGDSIPYRITMDNLSLTPGHTITISGTRPRAASTRSTTSPPTTRASSTPILALVVANCTTSTSFPIPADPQVTVAGVTPIPGNFTLFGGTITAVSAYSYSTGTGFVGDKSANITITFTATQANPVLAWGGHIATRANWGPANSAVAISGSPYHTRLLDLDGSGGNQDRSLSAEAVIFPASITIVKDAVPNDAQDFRFDTTGGLTPTPFFLDDDSNGTLSNTRLFDGILVTSNTGNDYTVTETAVTIRP